MNNPEEFRPKIKGISDFFSWNLYRWMKNHKECTTVYAKDADLTYLWIGYKYPDEEGTFTGVSLRSICNTGINPSIGCYAFNDGSDWGNINKHFWSEYRRIGVCAIWGDRAHKWHKINDDHRICEYCKKAQIRRIEMVPKEIWE